MKLKYNEIKIFKRKLKKTFEYLLDANAFLQYGYSGQLDL